MGGYLDLRGTGITALPENLTVGGYLYLEGCNIKDEKAEREKVHTLLAGDYVPGRYLYADNMLTHVRTVRQVGEYTLYIGKIRGKNVVSDGTHYAHCKKLRDGIADLLFKTKADRGASQYKDLTLDSVVKTEDAIVMYRVITGACRQGTQSFIDGLGELKEAYTVREIVELTAGHYGAERFKQFFEEG